MNLDHILDRLDGVRLNSKGAMAKCPAHDDKSPSLRITDAGDRVLLYCLATCPIEDIMAAAGLIWADLFEAEHEARQIRPSLRIDDRRRLVCKHHQAMTVAAIGGPLSPELYKLKRQYGVDEFKQLLEEFSNSAWLKFEKWDWLYKRYSQAGQK